MEKMSTTRIGQTHGRPLPITRMAATWIAGVVCVGICDVSVFAQDAGSLPDPLGSPQAKASYGIGLQLGRQLGQGGFTPEAIDVRALAVGVQDALTAKGPRITQEEFQAAMQTVQSAVKERLQSRMADLSQKNLEMGPKFLAKFKAKEGVKETPSGLLYKVIKEGTGASPSATDTVRTHYRGMLVDGTEFDSSYKRNQPAQFPLDKVIPGWTEALQMMKTGSKWQLVIPSALAYGEAGRPPLIGPNAVLVFEIELLAIAPPAQTTAP